MNILILGGSGFLSGTLARTAIAAGHEVWSVTRGQRPSVPGVKTILADRKDNQALAAALAREGRPYDLAVDCIGFSKEDGRQDVEIVAPLAGRLVFVSTDFVIDPYSRSFPQDEAIRAFSATGYGQGKRQAEVELEASPDKVSYTILRPCHIYGPGSQLGCLPAHGRDAGLIGKLQAGETLQLVGGGHFLQQPIFAPDLAELILSCAGNDAAHRQDFMAAGPDIVESREYYAILARALGVPLRVEELPVQPFLAANPAALPFLCHRFYDLRKLKQAGLALPGTPLQTGLQRHLDSLLGAN